VKKQNFGGIARSTKEEVSPSSTAALTSLARRDLFAGALGATAIAASLAAAPAAAKAAQATGKRMDIAHVTPSTDQADNLVSILGIVRGTLAHSVRESGSC
jgi:hypothetical protein